MDIELNEVIEEFYGGKKKGFLNKEKVCGRIPFGYEKKNGNISPNIEKSKVAQYIYKKYWSLKKRGLTPIKRMKKLRQLLKRGSLNISMIY